MKLGPALIGALVGAAVGVAAQIFLESMMQKEAVWFALIIGVLTGLGARALTGDGLRKASYLRAAMVALIAFGAILGGSYAASENSRRKSLEEYVANGSVDVEKQMAESEANELTPPGEAPPYLPNAEDRDASETPEASTEETPATDETAASEESADDTETTDSAETSPSDEQTTPEATDTEATETETTDAEAVAEEPTDGDDTEDEMPEPIGDVPRIDFEEDQLVVAPPELSIWQAICVGFGTFLAYEFARGGSNKAEAE